ncbi:MAG: DUF2520 domain-containing protein [Balneolales bacterium]
MTFKHQISIIGTGAIGSALAISFHDKGIFISGLYNRDQSKASHLSKIVDAESIGQFPDSPNFLGEICFICVPDDAITEVVEKLAKLDHAFPNVSFVHTSGSKPASALSILKDKGAAVASFHPLQTFDNTKSIKSLDKSYVSLQGDGELVKDLQDLVEILGARYLVVNEKQKACLHLTAVMASNNLVALLEATRQILQLEVPDADVREVMKPLIDKTWENILNNGIDESLTGPINRGDSGTIMEHISYLEKSPELTNIYTGLGTLALEISKRKGLDKQKVQDIQRILSDAK